MHGIYVLLLDIDDVCIRVGSLGSIDFDGIYAYVGSALNSLDARVSRHLRRDKRKHWHIDYLTSNDRVNIRYVLCAEIDKSKKDDDGIDGIDGIDGQWSKRRYECIISRGIAEKGSSIKRFGSSDCKCASHLHLLGYDVYKAVEVVKEVLMAYSILTTRFYKTV
jgi:Uri superfamily endonuclease